MVHRLERDQRQPPIDGDLGQRGVLHAVRPAPDDLSVIHFCEILGLHLGQQDDVAVGDELLAGADAADEFGQSVVGGAELRAVAVLEEDPLPDLGIDPAEMRGMDRQSTFIGLARVGENAERKLLRISGSCHLIPPARSCGTDWSRSQLLTLPARSHRDSVGDLHSPALTPRVGLTSLGVRRRAAVFRSRLMVRKHLGSPRAHIRATRTDRQDIALAIADIAAYTHLTDADIEALGHELDAIRRDIEESLGETRRDLHPAHHPVPADCSTSGRACSSAAAGRSRLDRRDRGAGLRQERREHGDRPQRRPRPMGLDERPGDPLQHVGVGHGRGLVAVEVLAQLPPPRVQQCASAWTTISASA